MFERARQRAETTLKDARARLDADDAHGALDRLERARRDFLGARDLEGLQELRRVVEDAYRRCEPKDEPLYEQLLYASGQNVRFLSRRRAAEAGVPWEDPHPELDAPGRPEIRVERSIRPRDVPWIVLFGAIGAIVVAGAIAGYVYALVTSTKHHTIVNDTSARLLAGTCDAPCDSTDDVRLLDPGERWRLKTSDGYFVLRTPGGRRIGCVHVTSRLAHATSAGDCPVD